MEVILYGLLLIAFVIIRFWVFRIEQRLDKIIELLRDIKRGSKDIN